MITTVAFDLDDTLYDEVDYCRSGFAAVAEFISGQREEISSECVFDAMWNQFADGNRSRTFNTALDKAGESYDDKFIAELINVYRQHVPKIELPQESRDVLCKLQDKYALGLVTDGFLPAQRLKVQELGIEKYFECIIYTEELGREFWKPSAAGFEKLMERLNVSPEAIAYVADNTKKDFIAPNKLGILSIQLIRPGRIHTELSDLPGAAARHVIHRLSELPLLLEKFGSAGCPEE
ncbi:MAG: HAD family hydrolase [Planctomycetota bacterium]|jgi:putative hydrolase of the HAD superfamily